MSTAKLKGNYSHRALPAPQRPHPSAVNSPRHLPDFRHRVALRAEPFDEAGLAREMQRANGDERAAGGQKRRGPLGHGRVSVLKQSAHELILRRALDLA